MSAASTADLSKINNLSNADAQLCFEQVCASQVWASSMVHQRPFASLAALIDTAELLWFETYAKHRSQLLTAIAAHGTLGQAVAEQRDAVNHAHDGDLATLRQANEQYETRHGHKCIVFASGLTVPAMISAVRSRLGNSVDTEFDLCAQQVSFINVLRLCTLVQVDALSLSTAPTSSHKNGRSPITSHVLDTSLGRPAAHLPIQLQRNISGTFVPIAQHSTDSDGRVSAFYPPFYAALFQTGSFRLRFDTNVYFSRLSLSAFYPHVTIDFVVANASEHYHVPLLLNPYGYSTYRGS